MADYFLMLDAADFEGRVRPALAACRRLRTFDPCRPLCPEWTAAARASSSRAVIGGKTVCRPMRPTRSAASARFINAASDGAALRAQSWHTGPEPSAIARRTPAVGTAEPPHRAQPSSSAGTSFRTTSCTMTGRLSFRRRPRRAPGGRRDGHFLIAFIGPTAGEVVRRSRRLFQLAAAAGRRARSRKACRGGEMIRSRSRP